MLWEQQTLAELSLFKAVAQVSQGPLQAAPLQYAEAPGVVMVLAVLSIFVAVVPTTAEEMLVFLQELYQVAVAQEISLSQAQTGWAPHKQEHLSRLQPEIQPTPLRGAPSLLQGAQPQLVLQAG
jgi:hypothetical protein